MEHRFVRITVLENGIESQLVASILLERGIPHHLRSYHDTAYDGIFQVQKGWGELQAPEAYRQEILNILVHIRENSDHRD